VIPWRTVFFLSCLAHEPPKAKPVPVQTWEGEGGALPATGAQMGPDPAVTAPRTAAHADELGDLTDLTGGVR
jgi:hypothetical protein